MAAHNTNCTESCSDKQAEFPYKVLIVLALLACTAGVFGHQLSKGSNDPGMVFIYKLTTPSSWVSTLPLFLAFVAAWYGFNWISYWFRRRIQNGN